jgi:hypothetical protein
MKNTLPLPALALSPLLLALAPVASDVSFRPTDGSEVTRDYSIEVSFELGDLSVVVDGQDMSEMLPADFEGSAELMMKVTESFVRSAEGRPLELIRTYEELSGQAEAMGESQSMENVEELEGKSVRFEWNDDEGEYDVSFHESDGDSEALEGLTPDMDLRALLPGKEVDEGDVWTVDARDLASVLLFGNKMEAGDDELDEMFETELMPQFEAMLDDVTTTCEYQGEREIDGRRVGAISVAMSGDGLVDLAAVILQAVGVDGGEMEIDIDVEVAEMSMSVEAEGEMLWDLESGHLHAFQMSGDMEFLVEVSIAADFGGDSHYADADAELLGEATWKVAPSDG